MDNLTAKAGPLPVYAWGGLLGASLIGYYAVQRKKAKHATPTATTTTVAATDATGSSTGDGVNAYPSLNTGDVTQTSAGESGSYYDPMRWYLAPITAVTPVTPGVAASTPVVSVGGGVTVAPPPLTATQVEALRPLPDRSFAIDSTIYRTPVSRQTDRQKRYAAEYGLRPLPARSASIDNGITALAEDQWTDRQRQYAAEYKLHGK